MERSYIVIKTLCLIEYNVTTVITVCLKITPGDGKATCNDGQLQQCKEM